MLVLFETSVGFCLFKVNDQGKLEDKNLYKSFESPENASNLLKLQSIHRFASTADAVEDMTAIADGKLSKSLKKFLTEEIQNKAKKGKNETLYVSDAKLGGAIAKKLSIEVRSDSSNLDLYRGIRQQLAHLLEDVDVDEQSIGMMNLGLSHSLSRYKLRFSPDKVDTMIVQAIALLDDLDKEINIYAMRSKEWYGWHFPEMGKIITDNLAYAKCVKLMGYRTDAAKTDFSTILPEDLEELLKAAAVVSMGTEISPTDLAHIQLLVEQVISITAYRSELFDYLRNRMAAIAPNLTALMGELVGARLIAHSGSLLNLAKQPASTIQILGAEKALFRALKTKHDTPKYGLIFHASLVGSAPQQLKGKMARMVAAKAALSIRLDALADADSKSSLDAPTIGIEARIKLESRLRQLEQGLGIQSVRKANAATAGPSTRKFEMQGNGAGYNADADVLIPTQPAEKKRKLISIVGETNGDDAEKDEEAARKQRKKEKKEKRKAKQEADEAEQSLVGNGTVEVEEEDDEARAERKRAKKEAKKAAKAAAGETAPVSNGVAPAETEKKEKSKKRKSADVDASLANGETKKKKRKSEA